MNSLNNSSGIFQPQKDMIMNTLVSCIICTYNRSELLKDAIESIIKQDYANWELIIVDDNSVDNTAEVVRQYQENEPRIKYIKNPKKGLTSARNCGIEAAAGEYVAFLDDDDISLPHRLGAQLRAMESSGTRFLVSGFQARMRHTNEFLSENKLELKAKAAGFPSRWMVRKDLLEAVGGFDETFSTMEDCECSYRLAMDEPFAQHDDIVTIMYYTPNSMSSDARKNLSGRLKILEKHASNMPPAEAAWWHYTAGCDYFRIRNNEKAAFHFQKAAALNHKKIYTWGYLYFTLVKLLGTPLHMFNLKVLSSLRDFRFPSLVEHPVVPSDR